MERIFRIETFAGNEEERRGESTLTAGTAGTTLTIQDVKAVDGVVRHLGVWSEEGGGPGEPLQPGDEVTVHVDADRRLLNARIHSAGHLLDVAMTNVGYGPDVLARVGLLVPFTASFSSYIVPVPIPTHS